MTFMDNNWPQPLVSASIKNPQSTGGRPFHFIKTDDFERPQSNHNVSISSSDLGAVNPVSPASGWVSRPLFLGRRLIGSLNWALAAFHIPSPNLICDGADR
jgi:hypothetical protein